jgi:di/tricarboxylate transporter
LLAQVQRAELLGVGALAGALASLVDRALGRPKSLATAQIRTMLAPGVLSAFTNNTPVVALMVPAIRDWAKKNRFSISKLLMPMNDAVVLGGLCSLIGTSTNVVVSGLVAAKRGRPLGMFDITWLGVPLFAVGLGYLVVASRFLLKDRRPPMSTSDDPRQVPHELITGDLNGDGYMDVVVLDGGEQMADILTFSQAERLLHALAFKVFETRLFSGGDRQEFEPNSGQIADVTGDGLADLVLMAHDRILIYPQAKGGQMAAPAAKEPKG